MGLSFPGSSGILYGTDAGKPGSPTQGDYYVCTDKNKQYVCMVAGVWASVLDRSYFEISDDILYASEGISYMNSSGWTIVKTMTITTLVPDPSTIRVSYASNCLGASGYVRLYLNGIAYGEEHGPLVSDYETFTEDLEFENGDVITIRMKNVSGGSNTKELRFKGKSSGPTGATEILTDLSVIYDNDVLVME